MPATGWPEDHLRELMRAAQAGDGAAYAELLEMVAERVRAVVRHRRGFLGSAAVEDVVQEILLSVHAVRHTYDPDRPLTPWLLAIVRHRLADQARRDARIAAHEQPVEDLDVTFGAMPTNSLEERRDDARRLARAIRQLPPTQRRAIELLKIGELSLKEASAVTGNSIGALKVATHRAMTALRKALGRTDGPDD
jgi:RNA polymerase sigma-70 factor (ECF subfamily)